MRAASARVVPNEVQACLQAALRLLTNHAKCVSPAASLRCLGSSAPIQSQLHHVLGVSDTNVGDVFRTKSSSSSPSGMSVDEGALDAFGRSDHNIMQSGPWQQHAAQQELTEQAGLSQCPNEEDVSAAGAQNPGFDEDPGAFLRRFLSMVW